MAGARFVQTVIQLVRHNATGAMGLTVNRPLGWLSLADLMHVIGQDATGPTGQIRVFAGGPVQANVGFILRTEDYRRAGTIDIDGKVAMTSSLEILMDIAHHRGSSNTSGPMD